MHVHHSMKILILRDLHCFLLCLDGQVLGVATQQAQPQSGVLGLWTSTVLGTFWITSACRCIATGTSLVRVKKKTDLSVLGDGIPVEDPGGQLPQRACREDRRSGVELVPVGTSGICGTGTSMI